MCFGKHVSKHKKRRFCLLPLEEARVAQFVYKVFELIRMSENVVLETIL